MPKITRNEILNLLRIWEYDKATGEPIYVVIPDDPEYRIPRGYKGKSIQEVEDALADAGWEIVDKSGVEL